MNHRKRNFFLISLLVVFFGLLFMIMQTQNVDAHASLLETDPAEKVVSEEIPSKLKLRFNEPIEKDLATVTIYDWNAKPVFTGNPDEGGSDRTPLLEFSLPELKEGTYTVQWNVVSLDGHPIQGSYSFAAGEVTEGGAKSINSGDDHHTGPLIVARTVAEGLLLLGAGLFWFAWLAERKKFPSIDIIFGSGRRFGGALIILGTLAEIITYTISLPSGLMQTVFHGRWDILLQFPFMLMVAAQLVFLIFLFIPGMVRGWYLFMWFALAAVPAFGGHVWGMENTTLALVLRVIHQLSIALWLGALCYVIFLLIWQRKQNTKVDWKEFRPFFVYKMMAATGLVVVSGVLMVFLQTEWLTVITDWMTWSALLLSKIVLTILMLSLALYQTRKWKKRGTFTTFRFIRAEWITGLIIILIGVWMSQTAYPISAKSYNDTLVSGQAKVEVYINQLKVGDQQMNLNVPDINGESPEEVEVTISTSDQGMQSGPITTEEGDSGNYQAELSFSMSGTWCLVIHVAYPGGEKKEWTAEVFVVGEGTGS